MKIKVKKTNPDGMVRLETSAEIKEVLINEDLLHPEDESIALGFRGKNSSGLIELSPEEFERMYDLVKSRMHLIKGFKRLSASGAWRI